MHAVQQGPHPWIQAVRSTFCLNSATALCAGLQVASRERGCSAGPVRLRDRSKVNQYENTSLIKIEHVNAKSDVDFYLGKKCA